MGKLPIAVNEAVAPGLAYLVMPTSARADPAAVIAADHPGSVVGVAVVNVVAAGRAYVGDVVDVQAAGIVDVSILPCREASPGMTCVLSTSRCQGLDIRLQAICAQAEATVGALPRCEHGTVIVQPSAPAATSSTDANDAGVVDAKVVDGGDGGMADGGVNDTGILDGGVDGGVDVAAVDAGL